MASPADRKYLNSHEWFKQDGDVVLVGISEKAVEELTDITYVEITAEGEIEKDEVFGEVESVKATSEMYVGIDGEIVEVNQEVIDDPSILNRDCYEAGWLVKLKPSNPAQLDELLSAEAYDAE